VITVAVLANATEGITDQANGELHLLVQSTGRIPRFALDCCDSNVRERTSW